MWNHAHSCTTETAITLQWQQNIQLTDNCLNQPEPAMSSNQLLVTAALKWIPNSE